MSKGTIIYMGGFELPDKNAAAHRAIANGMIMRNLGYDVEFVGMNKSDATNPVTVRREQLFFGFECWSIPYPVSLFSWAQYIVGLQDLMRFIKTERSKKVVGVVFYNYPAVAQLRMSAICRRRGIKHISDATEWYSASGGTLLFRLIKWLDTTLRMRFVHQKSNGVITTSKFLTEYYSKHNRYTVQLPTLFDTDRFSIPPVIKNRLRRRFIYVGTPFTGRMSGNKTKLKERIDLSILLFAELYGAGELFDFAIYGVSKAQYLAVFPDHEDLLAKMDDCVKFHGRQPNETVLENLAESDVSIFFRDDTRVTRAGFPTKLAESISCGTPVVSNTMVSLEDYGDLRYLFLAEKGTELHVIKKLIRMSTPEINKLKTLSYESRYFDYRNFQSELEAFFEKVGI